MSSLNNKQKIAKLIKTLNDFQDHLINKDEQVLSRIQKYVPDKEPTSFDAEILYFNYIVQLVMDIFNSDISRQELSYEDVNSILSSLELCSDKLIPQKYVKIHLLGRISQQLKNCLTELELDCYIEDNDYGLTDEVMQDTLLNFNIASDMCKKINIIIDNPDD